jgi:hypothetical protein
VDPIYLAVALIVLMPIATIWALSKSAQLRGPLARKESKRPVESLVTEAVPEELDEDDDPPPPARFAD